MTDKREYYETLFFRLDEALEKEFYLESAWIVYAIIEDRMVSILSQLGETAPNMLGRKVSSIKGAYADHLALRQAIPEDLLDRVLDWAGAPGSTDGRNYLMHQLGKGSESYASIQSKAEETAQNGRVIANELCAAVMRLKKRIQKLSRN